MDFIDALKQFSSKISQIKEQCTNEAATKLFLINPFLRLMGYDTTDPNDVFPEYTADIGIKQGEKVDYAILQKGEPVILIEAKNCGNDLTGDHNQLLRYFHGTSAKFGMLTNGLVYKFFTDLEEPNKMDAKPFLELDLLNIKDSIIPEIKRFCKSNFNVDEIFGHASILKYSNETKLYFASQLKEPSDDFVKHFLSNIYEGLKTQSTIDKFKPIIKNALNSYISELMSNKITSALKKNNEDEVVNNIEQSDEYINKKIEPTQNELKAFFIVKSLICENILVDDITYKLTESYLNVLYKNNSRKWICRLIIERANPYLIIPSDKPNGTSIKLSNGINDIYKYKNELLESLKKYININNIDT